MTIACCKYDKRYSPLAVHAPLARKMENTVIFQLEKISFLNTFCSIQRIEFGFSVLFSQSIEKFFVENFFCRPFFMSIFFVENLFCRKLFGQKFFCRQCFCQKLLSKIFLLTIFSLCFEKFCVCVDLVSSFLKTVFLIFFIILNLEPILVGGAPAYHYKP